MGLATARWLGKGLSVSRLFVAPLRWVSAAELLAGRPFRAVGFPAQAFFVLALILAVAVLPSVMPGLPLRALEFAHLRSALDLLEGRTVDFGITVEDPHASLDSLIARKQELPLLDPEGSLDGFFRLLQAAESGTSGKAGTSSQPGKLIGAAPSALSSGPEPIHILHYGDSPTTADLITSDVRRRFQDRFGDAGHGFSLVAPPWVWYQHRGVKLSAAGWNLVSPAIGRRGDGMYGLGGVSFEGNAGAYSEVTLQDASHTRVRAYFLKRPTGGTFSLEADGLAVGEISTAADRVESGSQTFPIPPGTRKVAIRVEDGAVRIFGLEFFKNRPGVVYSSLGLNGGSTEVLSRHMEARHWAEQLRAARPKLVVINYGTNESVYKEYVSNQLEGELRKAVLRVRDAVPDAAILIMSPMDRGVRDDDGNIQTASTIPQVVAIQQKVALDLKVAFFNTFAAMGGSGTMARWYASNPRLVGGDYIHPMPAGAKLVGDLLFEGLEEQYRMFKLRELRRSLQAGREPKGKRG